MDGVGAVEGGAVEGGADEVGAAEDRWQRLEALFDGASQKPPEQRARYLEQACDDPDLLREVARMLEADGGAEVHLSGLIEAAASGVTLDPEPSEGASGDPLQIGPYRIVREVGRGGMSTVYLAERADRHYRQEVAVKVVRRGPGGAERLSHLRRERQILAGLDHPHLAKLLDGGNTDEGLPYFVMDYVEGEPIDVHCRSRGLGIEGRLRLFLEVCAAVQYAHANLVIHRDIKPGNILVTEEGRPKLLDFGIAKLLETDAASTVGAPPATDLAVPTAPGLRLLTLEYASPEQVRGETLGTATDVYSLGVLLYELMAGVRPFDGSGDRGSSLERRICEEPPVRPSEAPVPSGGVGVSDERWRRRLRGDLDNIVLGALRKEPSRRYGSAEQLADDVRRHLEGRPVRARPDTLGYRAGKFLRRHRWAVATVALTVLGIGAIVGFYTHRLAEERDRARQEERESAEVARLLVGLFGAADPAQTRGEDVSAREVLDLGAAQVRAELGDQPELRADLLEHLASIYLSLGLYDRVERLVEEVETLRRGRLGQAHPKMPQVLHLRGRWMQATDRFEDAEAVHREALDLRRRALGPESPEVADSLAHLADLAYTRGAFEAAAVLARQSLLMRRSTAPEDRTGLAIGLNDLGATLARTDQRRDAEPLLREALDLRLQQFGEIHPSVAESLGTLGHLLWGLGQQGEAEELYRRALDVRRRLYGEEHPQVARSLNNLGNRLRVADRTTEAEVLLREAVTIFRAQRRAHRDDLRRALGNLAEVLRLRDRPAEALPAYREALELTLDIAGPDDPGADTLRWKIGDCLLASGDVDGAEGVYRGVLDRRTERYPEEHRRVAGPRVFVARALLARDSPRPRDLREAESLLRAAHPVLARKAPGHWLTGEAAVLLGDCRARAGRRSEARALLRSGLGILDATDGGSLAPVALERLRDLAEGQLAALGDPDSTLKGPDPSTATR